MTSFFRKLGWLLRRRRKEEELREELQFHIEEEFEQGQAAGLPAERAAWTARRNLGNLALIQEEARAAWGWTMLEQFGQDVRYAFRTMASNRMFALLAILSLALGIGANTAIYSFMDAILLRSLPVSDPESLVTLNWHGKGGSKEGTFPHNMRVVGGKVEYDPKLGLAADIFPFPVFELFQKSDTIFSSLFAYCGAGNLNLSIHGQADIAYGDYVSGEYFSGLRLAPAAGRLIIPDDDRAGAPAVAVVSFALSQRRFGGASNAPGQSILINNIQFTVVGVAPPEFFGLNPAAASDFYIPMHTNLLLEPSEAPESSGRYADRNFYWVEMMGRLRPGVSMARAQASLAPPFRHWMESAGSNAQERADLPALALQEGAGGLDVLRRRYSKPLYVLMTLTGLILAIACANIANLLLARAAARRREMGLRLSLGARRLRVVRQLLTESVLLACLGGALGVLVAIWGIHFLTLLLANGDAHFTLRAELNWHVLGVVTALSVLTGVVFGLAPALQSTRVDVMDCLKEMRAGQPRSRLRVPLRLILVASQIAISLLVLVAAELFVRTLSNLQSIELGFNRDNLLLFQLNARQAGRPDREIAAFYADLQKRFSAIPGVRSVSLSSFPLIGGSMLGLPITLPGMAQRNGNPFLTVGPAYFATMQIPILRGREFNERDQPGSTAVAVINQQFADANFGGQNPLGKHMTLGGSPSPVPPRDLEIVGVAANARYDSLKRTIPALVYVSYNQLSVPQLAQMTFELRTAGAPLAYVNTIREIVHQADARVPLTNVSTQAAQIDQTISQEIAFARLSTAFAILALTIACVGLYGTVAYNVARRTGEIGIRMALGAQRGRVVSMVVREVFLLVCLGLAIGMPIAFAASRLVESFLFGMKPADPATLTLAVLVLLSATLLAGYVPARRASQIDPMVALRHE
jgi:macrolide transport system ATP-binding/permease protein